MSQPRTVIMTDGIVAAPKHRGFDMHIRTSAKTLSRYSAIARQSLSRYPVPCIRRSALTQSQAAPSRQHTWLHTPAFSFLLFQEGPGSHSLWGQCGGADHVPQSSCELGSGWFQQSVWGGMTHQSVATVVTCLFGALILSVSTCCCWLMASWTSAALGT